MDPFYGFLIFAFLVFIELLLAQTWVGAYFRLGIPIAMRTLALNSPPGQSTGDEAARALAQSLTERFSTRPLHPSLRFKAVAPSVIAYREVLFENRSGVRYIPVMHSVLRLHPEQCRITVTGYINWYVVFALVYMALRIQDDSSFAIVAVLVLVVLVVSYLTQSAVNAQVAQAAGEERN